MRGPGGVGSNPSTGGGLNQPSGDICAALELQSPQCFKYTKMGTPGGTGQLDGPQPKPPTVVGSGNSITSPPDDICAGLRQTAPQCFGPSPCFYMDPNTGQAVFIDDIVRRHKRRPGHCKRGSVPPPPCTPADLDSSFGDGIDGPDGAPGYMGSSDSTGGGLGSMSPSPGSGGTGPGNPGGPSTSSTSVTLSSSGSTGNYGIGTSPPTRNDSLTSLLASESPPSMTEMPLMPISTESPQSTASDTMSATGLTESYDTNVSGDSPTSPTPASSPPPQNMTDSILDFSAEQLDDLVVPISGTIESSGGLVNVVNGTKIAIQSSTDVGGSEQGIHNTSSISTLSTRLSSTSGSPNTIVSPHGSPFFTTLPNMEQTLQSAGIPGYRSDQNDSVFHAGANFPPTKESQSDTSLAPNGTASIMEGAAQCEQFHANLFLTVVSMIALMN